MKYLLSLIFTIALLISCQKEDRDFETANKLISFSPNISQTDTRAADEYSLSDYFNVCSTVTVRMITGNEVRIARYRYKAETKKLEYASGMPLYYPEGNLPYQLIISWPDEETYTKFGEADYRHQEDENSFIRCDMLSDTVNNAIGVEYLPIYFKHLKSKFIFTLSGWNNDRIASLTVNGYKPFHNTADTDVDVSTYQLIYDPSIEAKTTDVNSNEGLIIIGWYVKTKIEYHIRFDTSNLKAGESRKVFIPFLYEFEK